MTNNKLKHASYNLLTNNVLRINSANWLTVLLCLKEQGVTTKKIQQIEEELRTSTISKFKRDFNDGISEEVIDRFLSCVNITFDFVRRVVRAANIDTLKELKMPLVQRETCITTLAENFSVFLYQINNSLGYGEKRLYRLMDDFLNYEKEPFAEAERLFGFSYEDVANIRDYKVYTKPKKERIDPEKAKQLKAELDAFRTYQNAATLRKSSTLCE